MNAIHLAAIRCRSRRDECAHFLSWSSTTGRAFWNNGRASVGIATGNIADGAVRLAEVFVLARPTGKEIVGHAETLANLYCCGMYLIVSSEWFFYACSELFGGEID